MKANKNKKINLLILSFLFFKSDHFYKFLTV